MSLNHIFDGNEYYLATRLGLPSGETGGVFWRGVSIGNIELSSDPSSGVPRLNVIQQIEMVCVSGGATMGNIVIASSTPPALFPFCNVGYIHKTTATPTVGDKIKIEFPHPYVNYYELWMRTENSSDLGTWWVTINGFQMLQPTA